MKQANEKSHSKLLPTIICDNTSGGSMALKLTEDFLGMCPPLEPPPSAPPSWFCPGPSAVLVMFIARREPELATKPRLALPGR